MKIKLDDPWDPWFGIDIEAIIQNMSKQINLKGLIMKVRDPLENMEKPTYEQLKKYKNLFR